MRIAHTHTSGEIQSGCNAFSNETYVFRLLIVSIFIPVARFGSRNIMPSIIIWLSVAEVSIYGKKPAPIGQSLVRERFRYLNHFWLQIIIDYTIFNELKHISCIQIATINNLKTYVLYENELQPL